MWDTSCSCRHPLFRLRQHLLLLDPQDLHQPSNSAEFITPCDSFGSTISLKSVQDLDHFSTLPQMCDLVKSISYCQESHTLRWIWLKLLIGYLLISFCRLLDQRKLPGSEEYVCCATTEQVFVNTASTSSSLSPGSNLQTVSLMTRWLNLICLLWQGGWGDQIDGSKGRSCHWDNCCIWPRNCSGLLIVWIILLIN